MGILHILCLFVSSQLLTCLLAVRLPVAGISLAPGYGAATIYFPNGTWKNVAKVDGFPAYTELILNLARTRCDVYVNYPYAPPNITANVSMLGKFIERTLSIIERLPFTESLPIISSRHAFYEDSVPFQTILGSLKGPLEEHIKLGDYEATSNRWPLIISTPRWPCGRRRRLLRYAARKVGFDMIEDQAFLPAADMRLEGERLMAASRSIPGVADYEFNNQGEVFLAVHFDREALDLGVYYTHLANLVPPGFQETKISSFKSASLYDDTTLKLVRQDLIFITNSIGKRHEMAHEEPSPPHEVTRLLLSGDAVTEPLFKKLLETMVNATIVDQAYKSLGSRSRDWLVFAQAVGTARAAAKLADKNQWFEMNRDEL